MNTFRINRRSFLRHTMLAAAAAGVPAWFYEQSAQAAPAAGEKFNVGLIGCGGMGREDARLASAFGNIVAVCDVDTKHAEEASQKFGGAKIYSDFRRLLEHKDLHAVINGTPDHWHTIINIAALRAGKDVYSEKPLTLTIDEGRRLVQEVKKTGGVLQTGSQQRSDARFRLACELVRNGRLGKLKHVDVILPAGLHGGPFNVAPKPENLDWDTWLGPAPKTDYVPERGHQKFRYWLDYSGGTLTDWGAHHHDIALWGMGMDRSGPLTVEGRPLVEMVKGGYDAPSQYEVHFTFPGGVTQTTRSTMRNRFDGSVAKDQAASLPEHGVKFEGSDGWIFVTRGRIEASRPELLSDPLTSRTVELPVSNDHRANFFESARARTAPICDAEIGHRSASVCHLAVIATRLGRKLTWDPAKEEFTGDTEANAHLAREQRKPFSYDMIG